MKKNLLSVLILVLLIVNIALTTVMMLSVTGTNKKTAELVTSIATVLNLELYTPGGEAEADVPLEDTEAYDIEEIMIPLAASATTNPGGTITNSKPVYINFPFPCYRIRRIRIIKNWVAQRILMQRRV